MGNILVFCAHADDKVLGAGGTLAKEKKVISVIFSHGEYSTPHLKREIVIRRRINESKKADAIMGGKTVFLGLKDRGLTKAVKSDNIRNKIKELIKKYKPEKIFTHATDDPLSDQRAIANAVIDIANCEVYTFEVWSLFRFRSRDYPKLVVDITNTFDKKMEALKCFESKRFLEISAQIRAGLNGFLNKVKYAEVFNKVK